jgi:hypothetical protein
MGRDTFLNQFPRKFFACLHITDGNIDPETTTATVASVGIVQGLVTEIFEESGTTITGDPERLPEKEIFPERQKDSEPKQNQLNKKLQ